MADINRYLVDGKIDRDKIVTDVKRNRIDRNDILELDRDSRVSNEYFGIGNFDKKDKVFWDSQYLDKLSLVSVAESFNREYLLYLYDVAKYVADMENKKEDNKRKLVKGALILFVVIIIFILLFILK